jgi:hypothetical protein
MLIVSTLMFIRWMIVDVLLCESSRFLVSLIVIILDEYNIWKNILPLFRLTKSINFRNFYFSSIFAFLNILIIKN